MVGLALICLWVGLSPVTMVSFSLQAAQTITGMTIPLGMEKIILDPLLKVISVLWIAVLVFAVLAVLRNFLLKARPVRETETWGCGYAMPSARMQYTASSFAAPVLKIFRTLLVFKVKTIKSNKHFPAQALLSSSVLDISEYLFFRPIFYWIKKFTRRLNWIQSGHTQRYLLYIFFFLLILLVWKLH